MPRTEQGFVRHLCRPDEGFWHSEQKWPMADLGTSRLSPEVPEHGDAATWGSARPGQKQQWPLGAVLDPQRSETRLRPRANSLHHLLQHDASTGHSSSWRRRWHLHTIPYWWKPVQPTAPAGPYQDQGATDSGATVCWRCRPCSPLRDSSAACNILLRRGILALRSRSQLEEDRGPPSARPPGNVPPTPHHNWRDKTERSSAVHVPGVQRGGQQAGKGNQCFRQTL